MRVSLPKHRWGSSQLRLGRKITAASAPGRADHEPTPGTSTRPEGGGEPSGPGLSFSSILQEI